MQRDAISQALLCQRALVNLIIDFLSGHGNLACAPVCGSNSGEGAGRATPQCSSAVDMNVDDTRSGTQGRMQEFRMGGCYRNDLRAKRGEFFWNHTPLINHTHACTILAR